VRAGGRFIRDEALLEQLGPRRLRNALNQFGLWRDQNHVAIKQVLNDFATYLYLPRLRDRQLLVDTVRAAISQLVCDHFAFADGVGDDRYIGMVTTGASARLIEPSGLVVRPDIALAQVEQEGRIGPLPPKGGGARPRNTFGIPSTAAAQAILWQREDRSQPRRP
jgi:hypothetical protein